MKEKSEQTCARQPCYRICPAVKQSNMPQIMMGNLVSDDECGLLVGIAKLEKAATKVNEAAWRGERGDLVHPRNLDNQALVVGAICLQMLVQSLQALHSPVRV